VQLACYARLAILDKERTQATWSGLVSSLKFHVAKTYVDRNDRDMLVCFAAIHAFTVVQDEIAVNNYVASKKADYKLLQESKLWIRSWQWRHYLLVFIIPVLAWWLGCFLYQLIELMPSFMYKPCFIIGVIALYYPDIKTLIYGYWGHKTRVVDAAPVVEKDAVVPTAPAPVAVAPKIESISAMLELPELTLAQSVLDGYDNDNFFMPMECAVPVAPKVLEYTREVYEVVKQHIGSDQIEDYDAVSYVVPQFNGKNLAVEYPKLICEKECKNLEKVKEYSEHRNTEAQPLLHIGPAFMRSLPGAHANCLENEKKSLCGRHMVADHDDDVGLWDDVIKVALPHFTQFVSNVRPYSVEQWLMDQPPQKREKYQAFRSRVTGLDFKDPNVHSRNFFIKDEVLVPGYGADLREKFPRGIQGLKHPETNLALGPFMHVVSAAVAAGFGGQLSYSSGKTPEELGLWYKQRLQQGYDFYEDDFSAFDSSQGAGAHQAELAVYKLFGPDNVVLKTLNFQQETVGYGKYHRYKTKYTRKSGDQNTSIGNTIVNMMAHIWAIDEYNKLGNHVVFNMLALGDDNLLAVKGAGDDFCEFVSAKILLLGLQPKLFKSGKAPTYCSSVFVPVMDANNVEQYVLVPEVLRRLCKLGWTVSSIPRGGTLCGRLKANEQSNLNNGLIPVSRIFNQHYLSVSDQAVKTSEYRVHSSYTSNFYSGENTSDWFSEVYGLSVLEIDELENFIMEHLSKAKGKPSVWNHPLANKMYDYYHTSR